jgi:hypothetical protein
MANRGEKAAFAASSEIEGFYFGGARPTNPAF